MRNTIMFLVVLFHLIGASAQTGISGGISALKGFGAPKAHMGLNLGVEIPRDDQVSFYGRFTGYLSNTDPVRGITYVTAMDPLTVPYQENISYSTKVNYVVLEGGSRYYIGDGYDSGFGAYGGTNFSVIFNSVKRKYDDFDMAKYELPTNEVAKGSIFNVGVGLSGGVKNTFAGIGTLFFDVNASYILLSISNNTTASNVNLNTSMVKQLLFTFALGFRRELY